MTSNLFIADMKFHHLHSIDSNNILFCKASGSYTEILFNNLKRIVVSKRLNIVEKYLKNSNLIRCHKSFLVNQNEINSFSNKKPYVLKLSNDYSIYVSKRKKREVMENISRLRLK